MILITSGALVCRELQAEVGRLPPSFLPLANRRLYEHQVALLRRHFPTTAIHLSLPDGFALPEPDAALLKSLRVGVVRVPEGLGLGDSVLCAINSIGSTDPGLRILHGDTLCAALPVQDDLIGVADSQDDYDWEVEAGRADAERVWCGWFAFGDVRRLARALSLARGDFVRAVRDYQAGRPLARALMSGWLDLGHVGTYFRSRAAFTTQRAFNRLRIADGVVRKSSAQSAKIRAEAAWFAALPPALKPLAPQLVQAGEGADGTFYALEYLPLMPLNELYVHGRLPPVFWSRIFRLAGGLLGRLAEAGPADPAARRAVARDFRALVVDKTRARLAEWSMQTGTDPDAPTWLNGQGLPSLQAIAADCAERTLALPACPGWLHGDLCFSNLLYDSRTESLKMLDPRGQDARGRPAVHGDLRYDAAKLIHSVLGPYDHVIAGRYRLQVLGPLAFRFDPQLDRATRAVQAGFRRLFRPLGLSVDDLMPLVVLLFVSMLPLHRDDPRRQQALLATALRLYAGLGQPAGEGAGAAELAEVPDVPDAPDRWPGSRATTAQPA